MSQGSGVSRQTRSHGQDSDDLVHWLHSDQLNMVAVLHLTLQTQKCNSNNLRIEMNTHPECILTLSKEFIEVYYFSINWTELTTIIL